MIRLSCLCIFVTALASVACGSTIDVGKDRPAADGGAVPETAPAVTTTVIGTVGNRSVVVNDAIGALSTGTANELWVGIADRAGLCALGQGAKSIANLT